MKKLSGILGTLALIAFMMISFSSCKKDATIYEVSVRNSMQNELMNFPFMRYQVVEFKIGEQTFENISYGQFSETFTVESGTDYQLSATVDIYLYNIDTDNWQYDRQETYDLGTETWASDECNPQAIDLKIGTLLQLYKAVHSVHCH